MNKAWIAAAWLLGPATAMAQTPDSMAAGIPRFSMEYSGIASGGPVRAGVYLADVGRRAALLGDESGSFEVWTWPLKLVSGLRLAFRLPGLDAPLEGATAARSVVARPEGVTITYTHPAFTVRQHAFVPLNAAGAIILLEVETIRALDIHVRMHADFNLAWPGSFGGSHITWQSEQRRFLLSQGGSYNAFIGSPFATSGTAPSSDDLATTPSQFVLRVDPADVAGTFIPIIIAGGALARDSAHVTYGQLLTNAETQWRQKVAHYRRLRGELLSVEAPDSRINQALEWSKVNLDQQLACNPDLGCGLVAGYGRAGTDNFRPGAGWFFGSAGAIGSLAMNAVGQFDHARQGLNFLSRYQREDGRIPDEVSHAAARLPWFSEHPYAWRRGDTTPLWILACYQYWVASGDDAFLREQWPGILRAFHWSASTDTDGDGLMENPAAGVGAIADGGLAENLLTDVYLAGVWVAALDGMKNMAREMKDTDAQASAAKLADKGQRTLDGSFWLDERGIYAFALLQADNPNAEKPARLNDALTVWPAAAMAFGLLDAARSERMLREIGSSAITADWGARMLSRDHMLYDALHHSNGTVSPFATGFAALAHYKHHRGWAGFDLVRDVARMTFDFARGRTPERLSGAYYQVLDPAAPQQSLATSMFVTPLVRGTLGWEADATRNAAVLEPHLPAEWSALTITNLRVGRDRIEANLRRGEGTFSVYLRRLTAGPPISMRVAPALPLGARVERVVVDDRDIPVQAEQSTHDVHAIAEFQLFRDAQVEFFYDGGIEVITPAERVEVGDSNHELKVLDFGRDVRDYVVVVEGKAGATYSLQLRAETRVRAAIGADSFEQDDDRVTAKVTFPQGTGFVRKTIRIRT